MRHKDLPSVQRFDLAFQTLFSELQELAFSQRELPIGSLGSVCAEERGGNRYWYWRKYDALGNQTRIYLAAEGDTNAAAKINEIQTLVEEARRIANIANSLRKQGYAAVDNNAAATLAMLYNAGVFGAGVVLVGTHAYGVILNTLGVRQPAPYQTEDIDLAQSRKLELALRSTQEADLIEILKRSGLPFTDVPGLTRGAPTTSFKVRGKPLRVDLLTPATRPGQKPMKLRSLRAYAMPLMYLDYLIEIPMRTVLLAKDKAIPVNVPNPARFALHKLLTAELRPAAATGKIQKDLRQAEAVCLALALAREFELKEEVGKLPSSIRKKVARRASQFADRAKKDHAELAGILASI